MEESSPQPQPKLLLQKPPAHQQTTANLPPPPARIKPAPPQAFRPKPRPKRRSGCRICCCSTCIGLLILILVLVIAAGIFYLIYDPALPHFRLSSFRVPTFNISDAIDGPYLNANTISRVEVKNRSGKMTWRFAPSRVAISADDGDVNLGSTNLAGFSVRERAVAGLKAETKVSNQALSERQRRRLKGAVVGKALAPSLEFRTKTGVTLQGWNSPYLAITVVCGGVTMRELEKGGPPRCTITFLKWKGSEGGDIGY
ncbi:NDR1/HIN1-like protein 13 isoform X1 [Cajanus cajan]|uniref:NDR1/HIN1-like protein 13 isoform X1 n=1 Tax=Cajanus cajan TaxID=3821 RepID=UPI0010FB6414|nr:NDR1/HIN1-like protein 13 isoform X1 [Cajanus cajan]